jgi:hypothetical protein
MVPAVPDLKKAVQAANSGGHMTFHALLLKTAGMLLALTTTAAGQEYPARPGRLIVPSAPAEAMTWWDG